MAEHWEAEQAKNLSAVLIARKMSERKGEKRKEDLRGIYPEDAQKVCGKSEGWINERHESHQITKVKPTPEGRERK